MRLLVRKLDEHSRLTAEEKRAVLRLPYVARNLEPGQDLIRQGDDPGVSALVTSGMFARYHLLGNGHRQYLSYHMTGDMPDSQALFIDQMDHAVCAIGAASVALVPHKELLATFKAHPSVSFAIWRETLVDAAIFRATITNNSARSSEARMAHFFCELFYRAKASGLTNGSTFNAPITLEQLGETLGLSIATTNRALLQLRRSKSMEFKGGVIRIKNWDGLVKIGQFEPLYLHLKTPAMKTK